MAKSLRFQTPLWGHDVSLPLVPALGGASDQGTTHWSLKIKLRPPKIKDPQKEEFTEPRQKGTSLPV